MTELKLAENTPQQAFSFVNLEYLWHYLWRKRLW